jgi:hypothetical protein
MENFEEHLLEKYPHLFHKTSDGLPECPCGVSVPNGWHEIVNCLCDAITIYTRSTYRMSVAVKSKKYYFWNTLKNAVETFQYKFLTRYVVNKSNVNKWFRNFVNLINKLNRKNFEYIKKYPEPVKIDQIKQKFGELRFYISGGDNNVHGMIHFAEYLCSKTCEITGEKGTLYTSNRWLRTLSEKAIINNQSLSEFKKYEN